MTIDELFDRLEDERERFLDLLEGLSPEEHLIPGVTGDWSIKDIIVHLSRWEAELVKLLYELRLGLNPTAVFLQGANSENNDLEWHQQNQTRSLDQAMADFAAVRKQTLRRLESFSKDDLNSTQRFRALGGTPLWKWVAECTYEHESEHGEQIRRWRAHGLKD